MDKSAILDLLKTYVGDDASDSAIAFAEGISKMADECNDELAKAKAEIEDLRRKYRDAFFSLNTNSDSAEQLPDVQAPLTYTNLFKRRN